MVTKENQNEGFKELARQIVGKVTSEDAGKITLFAVFTGGLIWVYNKTLESMNNGRENIHNINN